MSDHDQTVQRKERLLTGGGASMEFDAQNASILKRGAYLFMGFGLFGGIVLAFLYGPLGFVIGWVGFGIVGKLIGLIWGIVSQ